MSNYLVLSLELVECLDGAIGMLQDLDQNRKDAFRHFVQSSQDPLAQRRLTRAQFEKSLKELSKGTARTLFDIPGITNLNDTFALMDKSVQADEGSSDEDNNEDGAGHILLETDSIEKACKFVLDRTKAKYDRSIVPGARDLSHNFSEPREYCGEEFTEPCNSQQELLFRRNRNLFTAGEDNLVMRGVNLYGEKQWILIADRYLPERSIHIISQRYSKLCMMIYLANGIKIDQEGRLEKPPASEASEAQDKFIEMLKPLQPPAILNVHRWSLLEDMMLLKSVPILGNSWAKLGFHVIPYRDRGHLRKRYQVLERRVKSTMTRTNRKDFLEALHVRPPTRARATPTKPQTRPEGSTHTRPQTFTSPARRPTKPPVYSTPQRTHPTPPHVHPSPYHYPPYAYPYPYPPPMYSPGYPAHPPPPHDETSRAAFEKLAQESKGEWSQFSYMQDIMSPHRPSGAAPEAKAVADEKQEANDGTSNNGEKSATSLLADVLENAKTESCNTDGQKPATPAAKRTVYSMNGSPIGLSENFRSPTSNGEDTDEAKLEGSPPLESATMQSFPATSRLSHSDVSSESRTTPAELLGGSQPEHSLDSFRTYNSHFTRSRAAARPLFGDGTTLMETDLEAVSALNILSNSPALSVKKRKAATATATTDNEEDPPPRTEPKSLFATVVGVGSKKQRKKR